MSTKKPQLKTTLRDFYRDAFPRDENRRRSYMFVNAITTLKKCLGREPCVGDLNPEIMDRFNRHLASLPVVPQTRQNLRYYYRRIWRRAFELKLVSELPERRARMLRSQWSRSIIAPLAKGEPPVTIRQLYTYFYRPLRLPICSPRTEKQYKVYVDHLHKFLGREPLVSDFDDETMGAFFVSLVESGRSPGTANKARAHLLAIWRLAARKRFAENFPDIPRLNEPKRIPKAWSVADLATLFEAVAAAHGTIDGVPAGPWWVALHHLLWWTAERIGAVMQLRWSDVDLETGWIIIPAEFRKFQTSDKAAQLPPEAVAALQGIRKPSRAKIFPWPFNDSMLWIRYKALLDSAGLPSDRLSMFHRMRKSAASYFEAAGGNATELLGHSSRAITLSYLSPAIVKPQQTAGLLFSPGTGKKGGAA